jgi:hypothetical protein
MSTKYLLRSFAGGEITPELAGRLDLVKYQTGLSLCRNFLTLPHGPATRRPGFAFINEAKDSTRAVRLIPFAFSADQTVVLEFGHQYIRFHLNGETQLEAAQAIVSIVGSTVTVTAHGYSTGDWVFIGSRFHKVTSTGANTFTTTDLWGTATTASGATAARVYTLASPYADTDLFDLHYAQSADIITITHPSYATRELARVSATNWTLTSVTFAPPAAPGTAPTVTVNQPVTPTTSVANQDYEYAYTYIDANETESLPSATTTGVNALGLQGNNNEISWSAITGATRYNVYKLRGGILGYIGSTTGTSIIDDNILADTTQAPPGDVIELNTGAGDYPSATVYHEQRRWFAGTDDKPQVLWATRTGTEANLTSSIPSRDADGLEVRVAASQYNRIRHLVALSDLIALTAGGEFRIFADGAPAITPTSISIKPQGYAGSSNVQPAVTTGSLLYVQAQGSRIRELSYSWEANSYRSVDASIMAPHRFNGYTLTQIAYARAPESVLWAVRNDGVLLGMTYVPDQQVYGWHAHDTDGTFESVCVVAEGNEDVLYAVVNRTIDGRTVRYIERLHSRVFTDQVDAFYVDSGLTYDGSPVSTLSGLWHLEGEEVDILADGAVAPRQTVTNGQITLDTAASVVHVGLPITADLRTLPLTMENAQAAGQGTVKNINKVHLRVAQSSVVQAGPTFTRLREYPARAVTDPYGSPPALRDGELALSIDPSWNQDAALCVRQALPLPLTVLSMTLETQTGG